MLEPGQKIGDYRIEARAGAGGMGEVYRARRADGEPVALKLMRGDALEERFDREVEVLAALIHPGIARYLDHGHADAGPYLVMEWVDGPSLHEHLRMRRMGLAEVRTLGVRLAEALAVAHQAGIVHRDVKPANVLLPAGRIEQAKLCDFGLARAIRRPNLTVSGDFMGTLRYVAPEQARDAKSVAASADVYSLGAVLFECLAGSPAIAEEDPVNVLAKLVLAPTPRLREVLPSVARQVDDTVALLMAKDPAARPGDGEAARRVIERLTDEQPGELPVETGAQGISDEERRIAWIVLVGGDDEAMTRRTGSASQSLRDVVASQRGDYVRLADGTVVVAFDDTRDADVQAAQLALAWRERHPEVRIAIGAGRTLSRGDAESTVPSAEAPGMGHVAAVLSRASSALADAGPGDIRLGPVAEKILARRFVVADHGLAGVALAEAAGSSSYAFVGRRRELAILTATVAECVEESAARVVVVQGEAGMGKSRLVAQLLQGAEVASRVVRADVLATDAAFAVTAELVRELAGLGRDASHEQLVAALRERVPAVDGAPDYAAILAEVVCAEPGPVDNDAPGRLEAILAALEDLVAAEVAARGGLLLVIEDAHWADRPSLQLLHAVVRHHETIPLCVVITERPENGRAAALVGLAVDVVTLAALPMRACERMALGLCADHGVHRDDPTRVAATAARLAKRSGGNPLLLEELVRAAGCGVDDLPDGLLHVVQLRLDAVPAGARRVLRAAAIYGVSFWASGVAVVLGEKSRDIEAELHELVGHDLIVRARLTSSEDEEEFSFRHDVVREVAYTMLSPDDRRRGHALAARWLEVAGGCPADVVAHHLEAAGESVRARPWLLKAARQALDGNDFERVLAIAAEVTEPTAALSVVHAQALRNLRRYREAMATAAGACARADGDASHEEVWFAAASEHVLAAAAVDDYAAARRMASEVLARTSLAPAAQVGALAAIAWITHQGGLDDIAVELVARAEQLVVEHSIDDPLAGAYLEGVHAVRAYSAGDMATYLRHMQRSTDLFAAAGHRRTSCGQGLNLVVGLIAAGCYERALEVGTGLLAKVRRLHLASREAFALCLLSNAKLELHELDEAESLAHEALAALAGGEGHSRQRGLAEMILGRVATLRGDYDASRARLEAALVSFAATPPYRVHTLGALAENELRAGQPKEALLHAEAAAALAVEVGVGGASLGAIATARAEALLALGRADAARDVVEQAVTKLRTRAGGFSDAWLRERYLAIRPHRRLLELAELL